MTPILLKNCLPSYTYESPCTITQILDLHAQKRYLNACTHKKEITAVLRQMDCDNTFPFPRTSLRLVMMKESE